MGIIKQGILGGFSGKVGNVVGASWKGIDYIRSLPSSVSNPRTPGQVKQRTKFSMVQSFLTSMIPVIRIGFKNYASKQSAFNAATSYNVLNGVIGEGSDLELDYPNLLISRGSLVSAPSPSVSLNLNDIIVEWDNSISGNASRTDDVILLIHNKTKGESKYDINMFIRSTGEASTAIPANWNGDTLECYFVFVSEDGKQVSNSVYAGSVDAPDA